MRKKKGAWPIGPLPRRAQIPSLGWQEKGGEVLAARRATMEGRLSGTIIGNVKLIVEKFSFPWRNLVVR
jgi:hypothetical protein